MRSVSSFEGIKFNSCVKEGTTIEWKSQGPCLDPTFFVHFTGVFGDFTVNMSQNFLKIKCVKIMGVIFHYLFPPPSIHQG